MKKLLIAMMILSLLAPACAFAQQEPVRIVFWHSATEDAGELMAGYIDTFNRTIGAEKGIQVEAVFQGSYSDSVSKMRSILSAGNLEELPDLMQLDATGKVAYQTAENAYTIDKAMADHPEADFSSFLAPAMDNWKLSGEQLGLPFATSTTVTYYNKSLIGQAPDTLSDIANLAGSVEVPEDGCIYACVPNTPTLANWIGQLGGYVVDRKNGSEGMATRLDCLEDGTLQAFLTEWKALYASGALKNAASSTDEFVAGKQLIMTSSSSSVNAMLEKIGGAFELGVAAYPRVSDEAQMGATVSGSCLVMFDQGDARKEAAWELLNYLTGADVQADFAAGTGYLPSSSDAAESAVWQDLIAGNPIFNVGYEQILSTPPAMCSVTVGPSADFYYAIQNDVSEMLDQDLSPEEAVELMEEDLGGLLDQYAKANG